MQLDINSRIKLNNGVEIPYLGLGTYGISWKKEVDEAIHTAFNIGYRLIDTATAYGNEKEIGKAIKSGSIPREEIFITTKLDNSDHGYQSTFKAFDESLKKLDCDYIDLYLIHWPVRGRDESWKAMEELLGTDKCKAIGVSNYTINHLKELFENSSVKPSLNQIKFNPFVFQNELLNFCKNYEIYVEGYTPITRGKKFKHEGIKELSGKYEKPLHR